MSDLIERQAAIDALKAHEDYKGYLHGDFETILEALPSAEPEIIRCKDCKYYAGEGMYCAWDIMVHYDHFFCYHAERRTDG